MTTAQEKFDEDRKKMLAQMGMDEEQVEVEPEVEPEVDSNEMVEPEMSEYEILASQDPNFKEFLDETNKQFHENCDLILNDLPEYERREKVKEKKKQNNGKWSDFIAYSCMTFIFGVSSIAALVCYTGIDPSRPLATKIISPLVVFVFTAFCVFTAVYAVLFLFAEREKNNLSRRNS